MDVLEDKKIVYDHWQKWWQLLKTNHFHFIAKSKYTNLNLNFWLIQENLLKRGF